MCFPFSRFHKQVARDFHSQQCSLFMPRVHTNTQFSPHPATHSGSFRRSVYITRRCCFDKAPVVFAFSRKNYFLQPVNLLWSNIWTFICPPWIKHEPVYISELFPYISTSLQFLTKGKFCQSATLLLFKRNNRA